MLVRESLIQNRPQHVQMLVEGAARAGLWASEHPAEAAEALTQYWKQPKETILYALSAPPGRIVYDRFVPIQAEMQFIADELLRFKLTKSADISGLIEDRFARKARLGSVGSLQDVLLPPAVEFDSQE